ncbi:MAG: 4-alpha-glucanotransferase [Chlamydiota bacterium]
MECAKKLTSTLAGSQWQKIKPCHHHGFSLPLSALHSKTSGGIGEFRDLFPLLKWCSNIGCDVLQLLPLNDSGWDCSPYNAVSAFALNPIYLHLLDLPNINKYPYLKKASKQLSQLNNLPSIDYSQVRQRKLEVLRNYFREEYNRIIGDREFLKFYRTQSWLQPYSLFVALKDQYLSAPWWEWPQELHYPSLSLYQELSDRYHYEATFHQYLQYMCFIQLRSVKEAAARQKVFLKGDIPILISKDSCDVWINREYFHIDYSAGAPPDMYSSEGQNWNFPIYNWSTLKKDHYRWWQRRLDYAANFYDIYRLDHVVGFYRIWAIPSGDPTSTGRYIPNEPEKQIYQGQEILTALLHNNPMLPIAEDLGTVPDEVRENLRELGIPGTKVIRWERRWHGDKGYIDVNKYWQESMTTVSTHDSETLQQWWTNNPEEVKLYTQHKGWPFSQELTTAYRQAILRDSHHSSSLFHINLLPEYLALIPNMIHDDPKQDRINDPANPSNNNWRYRFIPSVEKIVSLRKLKKNIKKILP